ncbi:lipopolysaccharide biosynthesis protein, partial [Flavobacterium sp. LBUM151]
IILMLIYLIFKAFIVNSLSPSISNSNLVYYSPIMAFLTFIPALYYIYLRLVEKANKFVQYQILTVTLVSIFILLCYLFYEINLKSILISFVLSNFLVWLVVIFNLKFSVTLQINSKDIFETLIFAFPIFISYIAYFFISKYSIIILQKHVSLAEIGRFSLAQQIATIPSLVSIAISKAVQPLLFSSNSDEELKKRSQKFDENYKLFMIWLVGSLILSLDLLFHYLLPLSYISILGTTKYLLLINLVYNFAIVENSILLYKMKSKIILVITVCGSVLNIILSNILIQTYLLNGVLISMAIAFSVNLCLEIYFSRRYIKVAYNLKTILPCVIFIVMFVIISSLNVFPVGDIYTTGFSIVSFLILTISIGLLLKKTNYDFVN